MRPNTTQQRILILMTAVLTFFGRFILARGDERGFVATLTVVALGWLLGVLKPGDKPGR